MAELTKLGRYQLKKVLGRGAMGVVYEGLDPSLNRRVAVKTILKNAAIDDETAQMYAAQFAREAQAAGRLNHPNIVQVHDFGSEGDVAYLVMEYIQGRELRSFFEAKEKFEVAEAVRIMCELLDALGMAHEQGVIHRDIKPANVMLDANRRVKLADFGVARIQDSERSAAGTMVGTPAFMSPEQISGGKIDKRTDLFSAGTILYQLLTGDQPFTGAGAWTVAKKIMQDDPPQPSSVVKSVSPVFDGIVNKALAKKPSERYASAKEFAEALRGALGPQPGASVTAPPMTPAVRVAPGAQASEAEVEFWRAIQNSTDAAEFEFYLEQFPEGTYAGLARHKIARLGGSDKAKQEAEAQEKANREKAEAEAREKAAREAKARAEAEAREQARLEAERQAAARAQAEAEAFARREAAEKAQREAAEKAQREAAEKAREAQQREAAEKARREAETRARVEAELKAREAQKREAEEKAKQERARQAAALAKLKEQEAARAEQEADPEATIALTRPAPKAAAQPAASAQPPAAQPPKQSFVLPAVIGAVVVIAGAAAFFMMKGKPETAPVVQAPAPAPAPAPVAAPAPAPAAPVVDEAKIRREVEERIRREYADKSAAEQKAAAEKAIAEKQVAAKAAILEKAAAEKAAAEKAAAEKAIADKLAAARAAGERAAIEKAQAEKAAADAAAEKAAAEKAAADKAAAEKMAAEKAAAAKAAAARKPGWPAVGDKWIYEAKDSQNPDRRSFINVEARSVGANAVTEHITRPNGSGFEATHGPGSRLTGYMPGILNPNPYLRAFQELAPGQRLSSIDFQNLFRCNQGIDCSVNGRVVGREKVSVKAGSFDATKVVYEIHTMTTGGGRAVIEARFWYADAVNRFVKYELRTTAMSFGSPLMDLELVSYTPATN